MFKDNRTSPKIRLIPDYIVIYACRCNKIINIHTDIVKQKLKNLRSAAKIQCSSSIHMKLKTMIWKRYPSYICNTGFKLTTHVNTNDILR
jgi:hypothetical protein